MKQNQAIQYLALDVHQGTTVTTVRTENGSILMRATVATEARAIVALVRGLGPGVHVVFEEGTQAQWLHDLLPLAARVVVCNVRGRSETSNKSDRIRESQIEPWSTLSGDRPMRACNRLDRTLEHIEYESAAHDCSAHPEALTIVLFGSEGADCKGEDEKAISEGENRP